MIKYPVSIKDYISELGIGKTIAKHQLQLGRYCQKKKKLSDGHFDIIVTLTVNTDMYKNLTDYLPPVNKKPNILFSFSVFTYFSLFLSVER